jgi:hypothetical protein
MKFSKLEKVRYCTLLSGDYCLTWSDIVNQVKSFPQYDGNNHDDFFYGDDGTSYSVWDIAEIANIDLEEI